MIKRKLFLVFLIVSLCLTLTSSAIFAYSRSNLLYVARNIQIVKLDDGDIQYQFCIRSQKDAIVIVVQKEGIDIVFVSSMRFINEIHVKFDEQPIEEIKLLEVNCDKEECVGGFSRNNVENFIEKLKHHHILLVETTTLDNIVRIIPFRLDGFNDARVVLADMIKNFSTIKAYLVLKGHF